MVKKQLQEHDFLNGGPKTQYTITFGNDEYYQVNGSINFGGDYTITDTSTANLFTAGNTLGYFDSSGSISLNGAITFGDGTSITTAHTEGEMRYNTENSIVEYYYGGTWVSLNNERNYTNP